MKCIILQSAGLRREVEQTKMMEVVPDEQCREWEEFAEDLFKAYSEAVGGKDYRGDPLPDWKDVRSDIQQAWVAVAKMSATKYVG